MSGWRVRQSYGYGAARAPLAPGFAPGPFSARESLAESLAAVAGELAAVDRAVLARRGGAALVLAIAVALGVVTVVPQERERDLPTQDLVLIVPEPREVEPLAPEPEPLVEAEPEPVPLAAAEPVVPPPAREEAPPPAPPPARPEPLRAEPAPPPPPRLQIDALASAPVTAPLPPEPVPRAPAPPRTSPTLRIDPVAPSFPVAAAASATAPAAETLLRTAARTPARAAPPVSFSLDPIAAAPAPPPERAAPRSTPERAQRALPVRTVAAAPPRFDPVAPPARYAEAPPPAPAPPPARVVRTAAREESSAPAPGRSFQGVPLGSLAACVSDREEDALKLSVMAAAGTRSSCSSRAGSYRFVETKNLNAFLMWIERDPARKAADRCIELRLALECLAGTPNRRTDNG